MVDILEEQVDKFLGLFPNFDLMDVRCCQPKSIIARHVPSKPAYFQKHLETFFKKFATFVQELQVQSVHPRLVKRHTYSSLLKQQFRDLNKFWKQHGRSIKINGETVQDFQSYNLRRLHCRHRLLKRVREHAFLKRQKPLYFYDRNIYFDNCHCTNTTRSFCKCMSV